MPYDMAIYSRISENKINIKIKLPPNEHPRNRVIIFLHEKDSNLYFNNKMNTMKVPSY
jgi:hypothetical protein